MIYLDSSLIVSAITNETDTQAVVSWLGRQGANDLFISEWVVTEVMSALAMKVRAGLIDDDIRAKAKSGFRAMRDQGLHILDIEDAHFRHATVLINSCPVKLRAADALHLAVADRNGTSVCTLDLDMLSAAQALRIPALSPLQ